MTKVLAALFVALLVSQSPALAQATHTYVAGLGDDVNPCTRTAPCRTFANAISKTAANGIIHVLDGGGYGTLAIKKAISIIADGVNGVIFTASGAIVIDAAKGDVYLQGLTILAQSSAADGIQILDANSVHISKSVIRGFAGGSGISMLSASATRLVVSDTEIEANAGGVFADKQNGEVVLDRVRLLRNQTGIASGPNNTTVFHLTASTLAYNDVAIGKIGGKVLSAENNALVGNGSNGTAMGKEPLQ